MTQIDELERRITQALDRIAQGVEALDAGAAAPAPEAEATPEAGDSDEVVGLRAALEDEKLANAQLEERVRALHDRQDGQVAGLQEQLAAHRESMERLDGELQRLRKANEMLRVTNQEMRAALEENVGEPHLINKAMLAELESIRAARATEAAETRAILDALEPMLAEAAQEPAENEGETA
ncbi:hypothetical protein [Aestuariicoccus sp. MJ-SS9]|uniref:hypothetical protein n=1 Tax=Aestuariicoccus sp. MJ-SS9 TaxID=3079855 RepID=UPI00290CC8FB|nr:hypothetical protein [Aestuariicoccus sp. MJ-SS9]MDU8912681.1 hypothetical protein [Aestuariicoccus sp. MJ-SS9]